MTDFDLAVVGGGPVGLVAAIEARLAGATVVVIEQRTGPIDKACGEGLMPGALPILARLGVDPEGMPITGITYSQGKRSVTHRFESGQGRGVRRMALHDALSGRAAALGVERLTAKVDGFDQNGASVSIAGLDARYLLACDGLHSGIARVAGLALSERSRRRRYGIRQHYRVAPWTDTVDIHYGRNAEVYVTPVAPGIVGVAMLGRRGTDFEETIAGLPALADRLEGAQIASERRGAGPFRQRTRARTSGRVMLVGDASGYVDAITGEGLRVGFAQAGAAVAAALADDPAGYEREWKRVTRDFRVTTAALVGFATSPLRSAIVPASRLLPGRFGAVVESLAR